MKKYITDCTRVDIDTGEILENITLIEREYKRMATSTEYKEQDKNTIKKRIIIKYKHNGQTSFNF